MVLTGWSAFWLSLGAVIIILALIDAIKGAYVMHTILKCIDKICNSTANTKEQRKALSKLNDIFKKTEMPFEFEDEDDDND